MTKQLPANSYVVYLVHVELQHLPNRFVIGVADYLHSYEWTIDKRLIMKDLSHRGWMLSELGRASVDRVWKRQTYADFKRLRRVGSHSHCKTCRRRRKLEKQEANLLPLLTRSVEQARWRKAAKERKEAKR